MIKGIQFAGIASGIKASGLDLGLAFFKREMNVSTLYTRNKVKSAHILYNRKVDLGPVRAILVNSGIANACTGSQGVSDLRAVGEDLSSQLHIKREEILFASTGVIGKRLPADRVISALPTLLKDLDERRVEGFAHSIMTTDTYPKIVTETFRGQREYNIVGVAKGAGMINPLLATMLVFIFTDYPVKPQKIKKAFTDAAKQTFERITVDGECSTNDSVMLFTGQGEDEAGLEAFKEKLFAVMRNLSLMIVKDGEGATRVIHVIVNGAKKKEMAEQIARRIATSPLTKTAFFGCDPNWGRIMAAVGDANVPVRPSKIAIILQGELLVEEGVEVPFNEAYLRELMDKKEVEVTVDLHDGKASYDLYTTDLTYDYVKINASYRS